MKQHYALLLVVSILILALPLTAAAQQPAATTPQPPASPQASGTPQAAAPATGAPIVLASALTAFPVRNSAGQDLGTIDDVLTMIADGRVPFVVVSFGGFLGIGKSVVPVPRQAVQLNTSDRLAIINISPDVLKNAPNIDPSNWPPLAVQGWDTKFVDYWKTAGIQVDVASAEPLTANKGLASPAQNLTVAVGAARLSDMKNFLVTNKDSQNLGTLDDVIIDWQKGMVTDAIVRPASVPETAPAAPADQAPPASGGLPAAGQPPVVATPPLPKLVPVPWGALTLDPLNKKFILNASASQLDSAPSFDQGQYPDMSSPNWDKAYQDFWAKK